LFSVTTPIVSKVNPAWSLNVDPSQTPPAFVGGGGGGGGVETLPPPPPPHELKAKIPKNKMTRIRIFIRLFPLSYPLPLESHLRGIQPTRQFWDVLIDVRFRSLADLRFGGF
jgi:hypothetical protein